MSATICGMVGGIQPGRCSAASNSSSIRRGPWWCRPAGRGRPGRARSRSRRGTDQRRFRGCAACISRSPSLTCPTQRYCMNASAGSSTDEQRRQHLGRGRPIDLHGRSVAPGNRRNTLILKLLHSLQTLCSALTTVALRPTGIMSPCEFKRVGALSVVVAAVAASVYAGQAQDPVAKANAILAEARKAIGGDDKLAAIKTLEIKGTARRGATRRESRGRHDDLRARCPARYLRKESIILGTAGHRNRRRAERHRGLGTSRSSAAAMNFGDDGGGGGAIAVAVSGVAAQRRNTRQRAAAAAQRSRSEAGAARRAPDARWPASSSRCC